MRSLGLLMAEKFLNSFGSRFDMRFEGLITENEYLHIKSVLKREPSDFELFLFSAAYSEHCSYKHSKKYLSLLPRLGAIYTEENAGGFELGDHVVLFKMESHNHPCAVEPFNGAATGIGGIIRDVLAMNARPIGLCNSLKFGNSEDKKVKRIINGVVEGISTYGNSIGVPTVSTEVLSDECFSENPLVNVTAIGLAKKEEVLTSSTAKIGMKLMLVGSATMRDGMGGAAFASKKLSDEPNEDKISIQIANPFMKKKLIEACLEIFDKKLVVSCQDCGAAGILSSTSEVAFKSGCGVKIDLTKIHIGDKSIRDFEIMLSETQERMLFVVEESVIGQIEEVLNKYSLEYSIIGETVEEKKYVVEQSDKILADLPVELLVTPPLVEPAFQDDEKVSQKTSCRDINSPQIYERYDHTVGARTQFQPTLNPQFNSLWIYEENCFLGIYTFSAVIEDKAYKTVYDSLVSAAEFIKAKGFEPKGITNCLNFANPEYLSTMDEFSETINAMKDACKTLQIPVCSGNVSFYNEYSGGKIKNTPTFTMLGIRG